MTIDQHIQKMITKEVTIALQHHLVQITERLSSELTKNEYQKWGRYLTPDQAMKYCGFRSRNGFLEMCSIRGIESIKINQRVIRYDRYELDKINVSQKIEEYLNNL